jgi:protein-S-isoprenylcysteine O-methyltransferase Ste14
MITSKYYILFTTVCWWAIGLYWLINARHAKPTVRRQNPLIRWAYIGSLALAFVLLFVPFRHVSWLCYRLIPRTHISGIIGCVICLSGISFAIWARYILGTNWSGHITVKKGHELIRIGPYAIVRHPIYTGALAGMLGTAIVTGEVRSFLAIIICAGGFLHKLSIEESFMLKEFPEQYPVYRREVKMILPYIL